MTCPCATLPMRAPRESRAWDAMRRDISAQGGEMRFSSARYAMQSRSTASIATALCPCLSRCASCPLSPCILSSHSSSLPCRDHRYAAHAPQLHSHTATALLLQSSSPTRVVFCSLVRLRSFRLWNTTAQPWVVAPRATVGPRRPGPQSCSQWLIVQPQSVSVPHDLSMRYTAHASTAREQSVGCYEKRHVADIAIRLWARTHAGIPPALAFS